MSRLLLLPILACTASLSAQSIAISSIAATPIGLHAATEIGVQHVTLPTGQQLTSPIGFGYNASVLSQAQVEVFGSGPAQIQDGEHTYVYGASAWIEPATPAAPRSVTLDQHEVLVSLQASAPRLVRISAEVELTVTAGQLAPRFDVDVGDDGTIDASTSVQFMMGNPIFATTTAIPIRLTVGGGLQVSNGSA